MGDKSSMPQLWIVSPALADANNGNWQTARRWARHLARDFDVRIVKEWPDPGAARSAVGGDVAMIALHALRSAASIAAWHAARGSQGLAIVLTGTDLYKYILVDATARRSLELAGRLVVLQELAPFALPAPLRDKTRVIFQSTTARQALEKPSDRLRVVMVGHLREEKSPQTLFAAARRLAANVDIFIDHIGDALDPALGEAARATMAVAPHYRWLGGLPHEAVRKRIQRAHLLVHASRLEGGAHVIMEALASGTPVIASRVDGNVGMLGDDYEGYYPWDDAAALADLLRRCRATLAAGGNGLMARLAAQCAARAPLFAPLREREAVRQLVRELVQAQDSVPQAIAARESAPSAPDK